MADLKACPFCGSSDGFVERYDYSSCYWQCEGCLARGPLKVIEDEDEEIPGHDPALLAWNTRAQASAPEGDELIGHFVEKAAQIISGAPFPSARSLAKAREISDLALRLYTRNNAKAVDVESLIASCVPGGSVCDPQAVADNIREWFVSRSNAKAGEDAKDAEYGRALIVAMNCEYQHAKQMRGKKQEEWVTVYALLHRLKSAADNLTSTQRGDASEMGVDK